MMLPQWYLLELKVWLCTGLPLQWFFTAFNGLPFFSLPDAPGVNGPPVALWAVAILVLYHPILMAPLALWHGWMRRRDGEA